MDLVTWMSYIIFQWQGFIAKMYEIMPRLIFLGGLEIIVNKEAFHMVFLQWTCPNVLEIEA